MKETEMPLYYFVLKNGRHVIPDRDGEEFTHEAAAREYAVAVARELMRNAPLRVRSWRLQVSDENLQPRFELLFAAIDDSLSHLPLHLRNSIEHACQNTALLYDTIVDVQKTLLQVKETLMGANRIVDRVSFSGGQF
ncbi:MAG TPA: hypothetical protein VKG24_07975 [Pseudolabrys sp.]|nr:hypothetical protein [Pseudolabrys sp.]